MKSRNQSPPLNGRYFNCFVLYLIDFVEEVKRRRIAFLDGKDQTQGDQRFLAATELVHVLHFSILAAK